MPPPRSPAPARATRTSCAEGRRRRRSWTATGWRGVNGSLRGAGGAGRGIRADRCRPAAARRGRRGAAGGRSACVMSRPATTCRGWSLPTSARRAACRRPRRAGADVAIGTPLTVDAMRTSDIAAVHEIERLSFSTPWPTYAFEQELRGNRLAHYVVARAGTADGERVVGFAGMWLMVDEAHITTFGVHPDWRRQGVGARLLLRLVDIALELGAARMTLEVRVGNQAAQELYRRFGFTIAGRQGALLHRRRRGRLRDDHARTVRSGDAGAHRRSSASSWRDASDERAAHPGHRDQLRRDRRGGGRGRAAHRGKPGRDPDRAARRDRRHRAGGGRPPAAALDRSDPAGRHARGGGRLGRPRRGGRDLWARASSARCWWA